MSETGRPVTGSDLVDAVILGALVLVAVVALVAPSIVVGIVTLATALAIVAIFSVWVTQNPRELTAIGIATALLLCLAYAVGRAVRHFFGNEPGRHHA